MSRLQGRRVVVTGAASGIGLETAQLFAAEGARVALIDRDAKANEAAARTLAGAIALTADVAIEEELVDAIEQAVKAFGGLDGLVVSAGIDHIAAVGEMDLATWQRVIGTNLTGAFIACRAAMPALKAAGNATIVLVSSGAGLRPLARRTAYCASKAAMVMFGKTLAIEAAPQVRVNSVCPGAVDTPLFRSSLEIGEPTHTMETVKQRYVLERIAEPREIANAILFLTSRESSYVTGSALAVDAGRSFH